MANKKIAKKPAKKKSATKKCSKNCCCGKKTKAKNRTCR